MEKIAAKILECDLEKWADSTSIRMYVDYGCQQSIHISKETELHKMFEFFEVYKLADIVGKYCYVVMEPYNNIIEFQQFPCVGDMCLNLSTGEIVSDFERTKISEVNKKCLEDELTKIKLEQSSPKFIRTEILKMFRTPYSSKDGLSKSEIYLWFKNSPKKIIEQEFTKLVNENKIISFGNTRARRYLRAGKLK